MMPVDLPAAVEPVEWTLVFHRKASSPWFSFIALGRFKHVSAFAYLPGLNGWVIHDWQFGGLHVAVLPHSDATCRLLSEMFGGPDTEWIDVRRQPGPPRAGFRLGSCVGAVKHLLNLRTWAQRPDALHAHVRRMADALPPRTVAANPAAHGIV